MGKVLAGILNFVGKLMAGVFAMLVVITTVLVLLLISIDSTLLNAEPYKRALVDQKIYERAPALVADQMETTAQFIANPCADNPLVCRIDGASPEFMACLTAALGDRVIADIGTGRRKPTEAELQRAQPCLKQAEGISNSPGVGGEQMSYLSLLTPADWKLLVSTLLPAADIQKMTEEALDQVFGYLNGDSDSARVSLAALKQRLSGPAGLDAIKLVLTAQPPCTVQQLTQMAGNIFSGNGKMEWCNPPEEIRGMVLSSVQAPLQAVVARIPDEVEIIKPASKSDPTTRPGPLGNDPRTTIRIIRLGMRLSPLLPLGLLLLVTLFGVRSLKGWLRWWGIPMLIAGLIGFGIAIATAPILDWAWVNYLAIKIPSLVSPGLSAVGHDLLNSVAHELFKRMMLDAGVVALLGLAAIAGSLLINKNQEAPTRLREVS